MQRMKAPVIEIGVNKFTIDGVSYPTVTGYEIKGDYEKGDHGEIVIRMIADVRIDHPFADADWYAKNTKPV